MYVDVGEGGEAVLMLHGAGVSGWMWEPTRELLGPTAQAVVPDLPGFGKSSTEPYISHDATVRSLAEVIEQHAPQGAHVVGFSLGAQLAIVLAAVHPRLVRSVLVVSGESKPAPLPGPTLALLGLAAPLSRRTGFATAQARQLGVPERFLEHYIRDSAETSRETLLASVGENIRFTLPAAWAKYPGPATVMVGAKERKLMHESAALTASTLVGSTLVTVPDAAHDIPLTQPGVVAAAIERHLAELRDRHSAE